MRLLVIEDDEELCYVIKYHLEKEGYDVDICHDGENAIYYIEQYSHDLILLDRMLPYIDGLTLLQKIRRKGILIPVIMVTAMDGIHDRIDGLDTGADDYLVKPFAMEELVARIRALLRRPRTVQFSNQITCGKWSLNTISKELSGCGKKMTLSKREGELLEFLIRNKNQILSREQILLRVWGMESEVEEGNVDNYIHLVRRRLNKIESDVEIQTVYGIGYQLVEKNAPTWRKK